MRSQKNIRKVLDFVGSPLILGALLFILGVCSRDRFNGGSVFKVCSPKEPWGEHTEILREVVIERNFIGIKHYKNVLSLKE